MTKQYSRKPNTDKAVKCQGRDIKVHFKNTYETARMLKGKTINQALKYLEAVLEEKDIVPVKKFNSHVARKGMAIKYGVTQGRFFTKSVKILINLVQNLKANANMKQLETDKLVIRHIQVNQA